MATGALKVQANPEGALNPPTLASGDFTVKPARMVSVVIPVSIDGTTDTGGIVQHIATAKVFSEYNYILAFQLHLIL